MILLHYLCGLLVVIYPYAMLQIKSEAKTVKKLIVEKNVISDDRMNELVSDLQHVADSMVAEQSVLLPYERGAKTWPCTY